MAKTNPKYVRLNDRIAMGGNQHDLTSGWGISGFDVKEWPEGQAAQAFARDMLRKGIFEECSKGEYEDVRDSSPELEEIPVVRMITNASDLIQEHQLRANVKTAGQKVRDRVELRLQEADDEDDEEVDDDEQELRAGDAQSPTRSEKAKAKNASTSSKAKKTGKAKK